MKNQNMFLMACLVLALSIVFSGCEEQPYQEDLDTIQPALESKIYHYVDQDGVIKSFEVIGSTVVLKDENGVEEAVELNHSDDSALDLRSDLCCIQGQLQNEFRGSLSVDYMGGSGTVNWRMRPDLRFIGDIECVNVVDDQIILQIMITSSNGNDPFDAGKRIVTTLKDNGDPSPEEGIYDQIAKVLLIYAGPDECNNEFLPNVNNLIGFDDSKGNIDAK